MSSGSRLNFLTTHETCIRTGSAETEEQIELFLKHAQSLDQGIDRSVFTDPYMWKVMTVGRNGVGDCYEGSQAPDDTGDFFVHWSDGLVYLTHKAKKCIWSKARST